MSDWSDNRPWSDIYREAGMDWADKEAAAQLLEECRSAVLSQWMVEEMGNYVVPVTKSGSPSARAEMAIGKAEALVKASSRWREYNEKMIAARTDANKAKVRLESIRMRAMEQQAKDATARAEMRIT